MFAMLGPHEPASTVTLALMFGYMLGVLLLVGAIWVREHFKARTARTAARHPGILPSEDLLPY